jgi:hypothetical protein
VVIVDEELARKHWPNQSAINKRVNADGQPGEWATVIGVVGHVHNAGPQSEGEPQLYLPYLQHAERTMSIVARTTAPISSIAAPVRAAIKSLDADLPVAKLGSMDDISIPRAVEAALHTLLLGIFAATALMLASIGLYGVMAFLVSQRTREIGIRMALGGESRAIRRMVLREGILICTVGLLIGGAVSLCRVAHVKRTVVWCRAERPGSRMRRSVFFCLRLAPPHRMVPRGGQHWSAQWSPFTNKRARSR